MCLLPWPPLIFVPSSRSLTTVGGNSSLNRYVTARTFCDLPGINFSVCFASQSKLDRVQQELLDCIKDGAFFLSTTKAKYDGSISEMCPCGRALDTLEHRALECPRMTAVRLRFLDVQRMWHALPTRMVQHGLCPANPYQELFGKPSAERLGRRQGGIVVLLMARLSCCSQMVPAAIRRPPCWPLRPGVLFWPHVVPRWFWFAATQWLGDYAADGIIHVDSQYALDGGLFLQRSLTVPSDWSDRDLWIMLLDRLRQHRGSLIFRKVDAHLSVTADIMSDDLRFATIWNGAADTNAKIARLTALSPELAGVHRSLSRVHEWQKFWTSRCQTFLLEPAQLSLSMTNQCTDHEVGDEVLHAPQQLYNNPRDWVDVFPLHLSQFLGRSPAVCAFGLSLCVQISEWFLSLDQLSDHLQTVTFLELFVGFYLDAKIDLPVRVLNNSSEETWVPVRSGHIGELLGRSLKSRVDVFRYVFDLVFELVGFEHEWTLLAALHIGIYKPLEALTIPWPRGLDSRVSATMARFTASRPIRHSRDLARSWP